MHRFGSVRLVVAVVVLIAGTPAIVEKPKDTAKVDNKLIGTWKMISANYNGNESKLPEEMTTLKHVTPTQMMWVTYDKDGKVTRSAGGSYTLKGDEYAETPSYGTGEDFDAIKGQTHTFKWKIDGDKWHHTGKLANGLEIEEVWERVK